MLEVSSLLIFYESLPPMSNNNCAIQVSGLGKRYVLPRRIDNLSMIGRVRGHLREFASFLNQEEEDYFWALRDIDFEVKPGDILGILGRNGSGKSTLLKILSGVTLPSVGRVELRGRVGSLLEVGTGFHPDMTGRENVFMAGALLKIKQSEIRAKFDQIVDFSGIEKFIDMPVKRYSSGMYVRLAYSVASMLHADILILDEVMSVGDTAFREKSQSNIESIAKEGRTVLLVSHNARAVKSMCRTGMILDAGRRVFYGSADEAVSTYMRSIHHFGVETEKLEFPAINDLTEAPRLTSGPPVLRWLSLHDANGTPCVQFQTGKPLVARIGYSGATAVKPYFTFCIINEFAERVATVHSSHFPSSKVFPCEGVVECRVDELRLGEGEYWLMLDHGHFGGSRETMVSQDCVSKAGRINVALGGWLGGIGLDAFQGAAHRAEWGTIRDRVEPPPLVVF